MGLLDKLAAGGTIRRVPGTSHFTTPPIKRDEGEVALTSSVDQQAKLDNFVKIYRDGEASEATRRQAIIDWVNDV